MSEWRIYIAATITLISCSITRFETAQQKLKIEVRRCTADRPKINGLSWIQRLFTMVLDTLSVVLINSSFVSSVNAIGLVYYIVYNRVLNNGSIGFLRWIGLILVIIGCGSVGAFEIGNKSDTSDSVENVFTQLKSQWDTHIAVIVTLGMALIFGGFARYSACDIPDHRRAIAFAMAGGCLFSVMLIISRYIGLIVVISLTNLESDLSFLQLAKVILLFTVVVLLIGLQKHVVERALWYGTIVLVGAAMESMTISPLMITHTCENFNTLQGWEIVARAVAIVLGIAGLAIIMWTEPVVHVCSLMLEPTL